MAVGSIPERGRPASRPLMLVVVFAAMVLGAVAPRDAAALPNEVTLAVEHRGGIYEVRGQFATTAPPDLVWEVLTDYDNISRFVASMKESEIGSRAGARLEVRQQAVVGVFPLRRRARLTLDVLEHRPERIEFHDVLGQDFRLYRGAWDLIGDSAGTSVGYSLDVVPKGAAPAWLGRGVMRHSAADLLEQVRAEIERRLGAARAR